VSFQLSRKTSATTKVEWIVPDIVVRNDVNLIDGRKSSGKSSVIAKILGDWHNQTGLMKWEKLRNILWLSCEESFDAIIKPRLMQYGIAEEQITTIDYKNGNSRKPVFPTDREAMYHFMKSNDINAIVIDPFSELKPTEWSVNDGDQMRSYMTSLVSLCFGLECTAFLPRHMRKGTGPHSGDDGVGSVQIKAAIRHPLRIDVTEEKIKRRFLTVQESNIAKPTLPLQFEIQNTDNSFGKLNWLGHKDISIDEIKKLAESKVKRSKLQDAKVLLLEALKEGPKSAKVLLQEAKDYGIGDRTLDDAKAELEVKSIRKVDPETGNGQWVWTLPEPEPQPSNTENGEAMPQLTLQDLPPVQDESVQTTAFVQGNTDEGPQTETEPPHEQASRIASETDHARKPKGKRGKKEVSVNPPVKVEGKGRAPRKPKGKSK